MWSKITRKSVHDDSVKMDSLVVLRPTDDGLTKFECTHEDGTEELVEIEPIPMPANVEDFENIQILHFDGKVLGFLRSVKTLFRNVHVRLEFEKKREFTKTFFIMDQLLPLIESIQAVHLLAWGDKGNFLDLALKEPTFQQACSRAKLLTLHYSSCSEERAENEAKFADENANTTDFVLNWLVAEREVNGPRMLYFVNWSPLEPDTTIIETIKENFLSATSPSTFVALIENYFMDEVYFLQLENGRTRERLTIRQLNPDAFQPTLEICRFQQDAENELKKWYEDNEQSLYVNVYCNDKLIHLNSPTVGLIGEEQGLLVEEEEDESDSE